MQTQPHNRPHRLHWSHARRGICITAVVGAVAALGLADLLRPLNLFCWGSHDRPACLASADG